MSARCTGPNGSTSAAHRKEVEVEMTGYFKDVIDTRLFSAINDKEPIPERTAKEGDGCCDSPDISPVNVRSRYSHRW